MRFNRFGRFEFTDTNRKRAAFARKQKKERESLPLFAEQIASEQIDVDEEMRHRAELWVTRQAQDRSRRANDWRRARAKLRSYPETEYRELFNFWQRCPYPADPTYLLTMMHSYDHGRLDMNPPSIQMTAANRQAVNVVIAKILARKQLMQQAC